MRILAIYKYYWPDTTPYARILRSIMERWAADGHEALVLTAQPGYNDIRHPRQPRRETLGGVRISRLRIPREVKRNTLVRAASFVVFMVRAGWVACTGPRADVIIANPVPPVLMGLTCRVIKALRGIPYLYHCQDIHPESALAMGQVRGGAGYRIMLAIDTANCQNAALVVTLSEAMAETLVVRGVPRERIVLINNFVLDAEAGPDSVSSPVAKIRESADDLVVIFAGNLGRYQALDHVMAAAHLLRDEPDIKFLFMGEGSAKAGLMVAAGELRDRTVFFRPYQPLPVAVRAMQEADLGLVSLGRGVHRVAYPSKTMMLLAAGCPVLAVVEPKSVLAQMIVAEGLGETCAQEDHEGLAAAIRRVRGKRQEWRDRRPEIAAAAERIFGREPTLDRWSALPERLNRR